MVNRSPARLWLSGLVFLALTVPSAWGAGPAPRSGGILNAMQREDPPSLSIHDEATMSTNWSVMPCYNNLVFFNPFHGQESPATIIDELAEKWTWGDNGKTLTFSLRQGVRWHDGRPFTSKDVKYTFDLVRGVTPGLRLNPRKVWYAQVQAIEAPDP